eukprot:TRINITY_DN7876_c0_g2_i1.p1 TRINITY_DN7876_c0_g2~~TRINITY_DN7876_c0_g2_i1.p1  ORF type:complete len:1177 (-),score=284.37 TRINITY_DN7876_c0_g2_i1:8-3421(-)
MGTRVQFKCVDSSQQHLVFGATTGTLYFYERIQHRFIFMITAMKVAEPISIVRFHPSGAILAHVTSRGSIFITEISLNRKEKDKTLINFVHKETVSAMVWDEDGNHLFFGDEAGGTYMLSMSKIRASSFFTDFAPDLVLKDSPVVQLWAIGQHLLISSLTKATLYHVPSQQLIKVGSQDRSGRYGAVLRKDARQEWEVIAARPGLRLWVANMSGAVIKTLPLKDSLGLPRILYPQPSSEPDKNTIDLKKAMFSHLLPVHGHPDLILAWEPHALFVIDLKLIRVLEWHVDFKDITDVAFYHNSFYIFHGGDPAQKVVTHLSLGNLHDPSESDKGLDSLIREMKESIIQPPPDPDPTPVETIPVLPPVPIPIPEVPQKKEKPAEVKKDAKVEADSIVDNTDQEFPSAPQSINAVAPVLRRSKGRRKSKIINISSPAPITLRSGGVLSPAPKSDSQRSLASSTEGLTTGHQRSQSLTELPRPLSASEGSFDPVETEAPRSQGGSPLMSSHSSQNITQAASATLASVVSVAESFKKMGSNKTRFSQLASRFADEIIPINNIKSLMKDPFLATRDRAHPETTIDDEVNSTNAPATSPAVTVLPAEKSPRTAMYTSTKNAYESLLSVRKDKRKRVESVLEAIAEWISQFSTENVDDIPKSWLLEIFTSYLELQIEANEDRGGNHHYSESSAKQFLEGHLQWIHVSRALTAVNRCRYASCVALLVHHEDELEDGDQIKESVDGYLHSGDYSSALSLLRRKNRPTLTLKYLPSLLEHAGRGALDLCMYQYPAIQPWNVDHHKTKDPVNYLYYLNQIMKNPECSKDPGLVEEWFLANLSDSPPPYSSLWENKIPKRGAHLLKWKNEDNLNHVINRPNQYAYNAQSMIVHCLTSGYFKGLASLYLRSKAHTLQAIDLILECDMPDAFDKLMSGDYDRMDWSYLVERMDKLQDTDEGRVITRDLVVQEMIACLGVSESLDVLGEHPHFASQLSTSTWIHFVEGGRIEKKQEQIIHEMIELTDSYLWSSRPVAFAPQIRSLIDTEIKGKLDSLPYLMQQTDLRGQSEYAFKFDHTVPLPNFYEENAGHWGIPLGILDDLCPYCTLPIRLNAGPSTSISIFPCGHAYHDMCAAPDNACSTCLATHLRLEN